MWLFTKHGFYSATMSPVKKGHIQIRARVRKDIERLKQAFPDQLAQAKIIETKQADYRWRTVMTPSKFAVLMMHLAEDIDYGNFKNAAKANGLDTGPHHAVWSIMYAEQSRERERERRHYDDEALPGLRSRDLTDDEEWLKESWIDDDEDDDDQPDWLRGATEEDEEPEDDGQCPDCRIDWAIDTLGTKEQRYCPHCNTIGPA